ncbi:MAG: glycosyltransferase family 9 protein [Calditrichaeota bacterium]|nr:glycosyltransferase family 9 protein [Calditrichota bacterium]
MSGFSSHSSVIVQLARLGDLVQSRLLVSRLQEQNGVNLTTLVVDERLDALAGLMVGDDCVITVPTEEMRKSFACRNQSGLWNKAKWLSGLLKQREFDQVINLNYHPSAAAIAEVIPAGLHRGARWADVKNDIPSDEQLRTLFTAAAGMRKGGRHLSDIWCDYADNSTVYNTFQPLDLPDYLIERSRNLLDNSFPDRTIEPIAVVIGSGMKERSLSTQFLCRLTETLSRVAPVILIGTENDVETAYRILEQSGVDSSRAVSLCGKTDLLTLSGVLKISKLTIGVDTGALHLSAMVGTKCLGIYFGSMNFRETGPYGDGHLVITPDDPDYPCQERDMELYLDSHYFDVDAYAVASIAVNVLNKQPLSCAKDSRIYESFTSVDGLGWKEQGSK